MKYTAPFTRLIAWVPIVVFVFAGAVFIRYFDRGFDLTDESFYLLNAQDPFSLTLRLFDFGYYLRPLLNLVSKDIYLFRVSGLIILSFSTCIMAYSLLRLIDAMGIHLKSLTKFSVVAALIVASWAYYSAWLLSPGYNWMALVAITFCVSSLSFYSTNAISNPEKFPLIPLIGLGLGGALTFFAKPPSAVFLGIVTIVWIVFFPSQCDWKKKIQHVVVAIIVAVLALAVHFIFVTEGIETAIAEYTLAYDIFNNIKGYQSSSFFGLYQSIAQNILHMIWADKIFLILVAVSIPLNIMGKKEFWFPIATLIFAVNAIAILIMTGAPTPQRYGDFLLTVMAQFLILSLILTEPTKRKQVLISFLTLVAFTFAFHFGTGSANAFHFAIGFLFFASALVFVSALSAPAKFTNFAVGIMSVFVVAASIIGISGGVREPYRQRASIWELTQPIQITPNTTPLLVKPEQGDYMLALREGALTNGWQSGETLLDMTGIRPGVTFMLEGHPPAVKWLPLQVNVPTVTLASVLNALPESELSTAWILRSFDVPENSRVSDDLFSMIDINFPSDYHLVAEHSGHGLWRPCKRDDDLRNRDLQNSDSNDAIPNCPVEQNE